MQCHWIISVAEADSAQFDRDTLNESCAESRSLLPFPETFAVVLIVGTIRSIGKPAL
jgi:hypothetical protein